MVLALIVVEETQFIAAPLEMDIPPPPPAPSREAALVSPQMRPNTVIDCEPVATAFPGTDLVTMLESRDHAFVSVRELTGAAGEMVKTTDTSPQDECPSILPDPQAGPPPPELTWQKIAVAEIQDVTGAFVPPNRERCESSSQVFPNPCPACVTRTEPVIAPLVETVERMKIIPRAGFESIVTDRDRHPLAVLCPEMITCCQTLSCIARLVLPAAADDEVQTVAICPLLPTRDLPNVLPSPALFNPNVDPIKVTEVDPVIA